MNQHDGLKMQERKEKGETCTCRSGKHGQNIYVMMGERKRKLEEIAVWMCIQIIENVRRVSNRNQRCKRNDFFWRNDFPGGSDGKTSAYNVGDPSSIPGSGRSLGEGNGNPLQCSCLENPMEKSLVGYSPQGCQESDTTKQLHFHFYFHYFWMVKLFCIYNDLWVLKYHPQKRISCQFAVHSYIVNDINIVNICELAEWQFANNLRKQV